MIRIQEAPFDPAEAFELQNGRTDVGGLTVFIGYVRDLTNDTAVTTLELQHYPGFTEAEIQKIADEAQARFTPLDVKIIHRFGHLCAGEPIVLVAVAATHRDAAFEAARFIMDYLKTGAPYWKREHGPDGSRWIEPRPTDYTARSQWLEQVQSPEEKTA